MQSLERTATVITSGIGGFPAIVEAVRTTDQHSRLCAREISDLFRRKEGPRLC
jgi:hypothetical protein